MARFRVRMPGHGPLWKCIVLLGFVLMAGSTYLGQNGYFGLEFYSVTVMLPIYVGAVLLILGVTKLQRRKRPFFATFFLGTTALAFLAVSDLLIHYEARELSMIRDTMIFLVIVAMASFLIITSFRSLSNKRKAYQSFSVVLFNLGALGIVAKHLVAPGLHCYACPWATAGCPVGILQNWVIMGQIPYYLIGSSVAVFTIFGRAYCGWACPFGFLHDILNFISSVKYRRNDLNGHLSLRSKMRSKDKVGYLSYITRSTILVALFIAVWRSAETWFCKLCPAGFIEAALPYRLNHNVVPDPLFVFRVVIFFSLMLIAVVVSRYWCRFFCPVGHLGGHFNSISLLHLDLDENLCNGCGLCSKGCPMELDPEQFLRKDNDNDGSLMSRLKGFISKDQTNCILCGECVDNCRNNALSLTLLPGAKRGGSIGSSKKRTGKFVDDIHSTGNKLFRGLHQDKMASKTYQAEMPVVPSASVGDHKRAVQQAPLEGRELARQASDDYAWQFPVSIYVFYGSYAELPRNLEQFRSRQNYNVHFIGIYDDEEHANFFNSLYREHVKSPVIVINGQLYLGNAEDNDEILHFVEDVQDTYSGIYVFWNGDVGAPDENDQIKRSVGDLVLQKGEQYPLSMFNTLSPGALMSSCGPDSMYALYGKSSHSPHKISEYIRHKGLSYHDKDLVAFKDIPVTTVEMYLKKGSDLSNEILNVVSRASYQSGGKLRFFITEWNNEIPSIIINGNEVPQHNYPSSFFGLLTMIRKYGKK